MEIIRLQAWKRTEQAGTTEASGPLRRGRDAAENAPQRTTGAAQRSRGAGLDLWHPWRPQRLVAPLVEECQTQVPTRHGHDNRNLGAYNSAHG